MQACHSVMVLAPTEVPKELATSLAPIAHALQNKMGSTCRPGQSWVRRCAGLHIKLACMSIQWSMPHMVATVACKQGFQAHYGTHIMKATMEPTMTSHK